MAKRQGNGTATKGSGSALQFGRQLAGVDKKDRDKGVKVLSRWLQKRSSLTELEMLKIWKGLWYCLWLSDKPAVQAELCGTISKLLHNVPLALAPLYFKAFLVMAHKEWSSLQQLRLDKFMLLTRTMLHEVLQLLFQHKWKGNVFEQVVEALQLSGLHPHKGDVGLKIHTSEVFLEELEKVVPLKQVPAEVLDTLIQPFYLLLSEGDQLGLNTKIVEEVFIKLAEPDEEGEPRTNLVLITDKLFALASSKATLEDNREQLYNIHHRFELSLEAVVEALSNEDLDLLPWMEIAKQRIMANFSVEEIENDTMSQEGTSVNEKPSKLNEQLTNKPTNAKKRKVEGKKGTEQNEQLQKTVKTKKLKPTKEDAQDGDGDAPIDEDELKFLESMGFSVLPPQHPIGQLPAKDMDSLLQSPSDTKKVKGQEVNFQDEHMVHEGVEKVKSVTPSRRVIFSKQNSFQEWKREINITPRPLPPAKRGILKSPAVDKNALSNTTPKKVVKKTKK